MTTQTTTRYIVHGINCLNGKYSQQTYRKLQSAINAAKGWKERYTEMAAADPHLVKPEEGDFYIERQVTERIEF